MFRFVVLALLIASACAFLPTQNVRVSRSELAMKSNEFQKVLAASMVGASLMFGTAARAEVDYEGIRYLGGGDKIDLNNANVRSYLKLPGLYPTIAGKVASNKTPLKSVADVYNIAGLTPAEKEVLKKYESKFIVLDVKPEYVIDKINNGLYR